MKPFKEYLSESSLSRVYAHAMKHEVGTITAYRSARDCNTGEDYTHKDNEARNRLLASKLLKLGYNITGIKGSYIEAYKTADAKEVEESSFLVVDVKDKGSLRADLIKLGTEFEQDSITWSAPGQAAPYYLISSNKCKNGYPGLGKIGIALKLGKSLFGKDGEFFSRVNGRPFVFEGITDPLYDYTSLSIRSKQAVTVMSEQTVENTCTLV
ncbi:MAG: hypothetical protein R8M45_04450 [Ghiorsea sp.]